MLLDRGVHLEAPDPQGLPGHDAAHRDHGHLAGAAADVDDEVADGFVDGEARTDRGGERLVDERHVARSRGLRRLLHRAALHLRDRRRHAHQHPRLGEPADPNPLQDHADHPLRDVEVGDGAVAEGPDRHDVRGRPADHVPGLLAHREDLASALVHRDHGGLVEHDAVALAEHERVRRTEVDGQVPHPNVLTSRAPTRTRRS